MSDHRTIIGHVFEGTPLPAAGSSFFSGSGSGSAGVSGSSVAGVCSCTTHAKARACTGKKKKKKKKRGRESARQTDEQRIRRGMAV